MTNGYYRAAAGQDYAIGRIVESAFDKLPGEREIKEGRVVYAVATGGPGAYAVEMPYPITEYTDGLEIAVKFETANAGAATLNVDGRGPVQMVDHEGSRLPANYFIAGMTLTLRYSSAGAGRLVVQSGRRGLQGLRGVPYRFTPSWGAPNGPGDGRFGLNAATPAEVSAIGMSYRDLEGSDLGGYLASFAGYGDSTGHGHLIVGNSRMIGDGVVFLVTETETHGAPFDWIHLTVEHLSGDTLPNLEDVYGLQFAPIGKGGRKGVPGDAAVIPSDVPRLWSGSRAAFEALTSRTPGTLYAVLAPQ